MRRTLFIPLAVLLLASCNSGDGSKQTPATSSAPAPASPAKTQVQPQVVVADGTAYYVELATDDETREEGLMYRESLLPKHGMLFIFPNTGEYPFWMKNTLIPLDMIWIDEGGRIVHVARDVPPCRADPCPSYAPHAQAKYVLELAGGETAQHHVENGQQVRFVDIAQFAVR